MCYDKNEEINRSTKVVTSEVKRSLYGCAYSDVSRVGIFYRFLAPLAFPAPMCYDKNEEINRSTKVVTSEVKRSLYGCAYSDVSRVGIFFIFYKM